MRPPTSEVPLAFAAGEKPAPAADRFLPRERRRPSRALVVSLAALALVLIGALAVSNAGLMSPGVVLAHVGAIGAVVLVVIVRLWVDYPDEVSVPAERKAAFAIPQALIEGAVLQDFAAHDPQERFEAYGHYFMAHRRAGRFYEQWFWLRVVQFAATLGVDHSRLPRRED